MVSAAILRACQHQLLMMNMNNSSTNTQQQDPPQQARAFGAHPGIQNRGDSANLGVTENLPLQSSGQSSGLGGDAKQQGSSYNLNSGVHHADHHGNILNAVPIISQAKSGEHRRPAATLMLSYCMPPRT